MRLAFIALFLMIGSQAGAECGKLCDWGWWYSATEAHVQAEIDAGADVMAREVVYGDTPLHEAAAYGTPENIQALLDAGADVMARDEDGETPLHRAAMSGTAANVQALLDAGADGKAITKFFNTPWDLAQENEKLKGTAAYWALNDARLN